ncbi:MAG: sigma-70 family RNA polymerase sigma factor [Anaerolineales bacterium]
MDEITLLSQAQRGDLDAFNRLVLAYQDQLFNIAFRILGDEDLAADATQEAFLHAFQKITTFRSGSLRGWLIRIVTNLCYDELRRQKRRPQTALEPLTAEGDEVESPSWMSDSRPSPEASLEQKELEHALEHCLQALPLPFRAIVVLADIEGLDYSEIAVALRIPLGTVKSRLARARMRLRECLQQFQELLPSIFRHA